MWQVLVLMTVRLGGVDGGWEGFLKDPARDGTCQFNVGVKRARDLMLQILRLGVPTASDFDNSAAGATRAVAVG
eukprot:1266448-Prymnesium_polylepis.1